MDNIMSQKNALKDCWERIKRYWHMIIASLLFATTYVVLSLYIPKLIGHGTDKIIGAGAG